MDLRHSCLIAAVHEASLTLRRATYAMPNIKELRHSCCIVATHETSFTLCGATGVTLQDHQVLRLPQKKWAPNLRENERNVIYSPRTIREWSETARMIQHEPVSPQPARSRRPPVALSRHIWAHFVWKNILFYAPANKQKINHISPNIAPATKTDKPRSPNSHQVSRLPRKVTSQDYQINTWNVIYIARSNLWDAKRNGTTTLFDSPSTWNVIIAPSNRSHLPTSPNNIAPATKSGIPKYERKRLKRHFQCAADPRTIREWSEHEPVSPQPAHSRRFPVSWRILYGKHFIFVHRLTNKKFFASNQSLHLPRKVASPDHQITTPATKNEKLRWSWNKRHLHCADYRSRPPTSSNTAPATKSDATKCERKRLN